MERNRRRVDGSSTDFDLGLHRLAAAADGGGSGDYSAVQLAYASLLTTKLCGFNFVIVIDFKPIMRYTWRLFPISRFNFLLYYYTISYSLTSDLENLFQQCPLA